MRLKDGFVLREVAGSFVVVAVGERVKDFRGVINLNETGAFIWKNLEEETTEEILVKKLLEEYDVDSKTALESIKGFVQKIQEAGLLQ